MKSVWKIQIGETVECAGKIYTVSELLDLDTVLIKELQTGTSKTEKIKHLKLYSEDRPDESKKTESAGTQEIDLSTVPDEKWKAATLRANAVKSLLALPKLTSKDVQQKATEIGVSQATMYRYINKYLSTEKTSSLLPNASDGGRGKPRITEEAETILQETINEFYLTKQQPKIQKVVREYERRCYNAGIKAAKESTVRNRIKHITEKIKTKARRGRNAARSFDATPGMFPEGRFPLEVTQIDHTPIDLIFVDKITREIIGKLWLTVLIDVFSRMILGFYISPDAPGITPLGMCLTNAILPKENDLERLNIEDNWKTWGLMNKIHADNAGEFRGYDLRRICQEYDVDLEWRPVGRPQYGSHIERLLGTFMQEVHLLPGTTFSNIQKKGDYDSEREAVFTYDEFEQWLTTYIVGVYHKKAHDGIGMPPEVMYERGLLLGTDEFPAVGFPPRIMDERKLRIDMLPAVERTVQQFGVEIDLIRYYDPVLNPFIGAKDLNHTGLARKFIFKRNPRSLRKIYFYHPNLRQYFEIPYRNLVNPDMTLWEYRRIRKELEDEGKKSVSEDDIFENLNKMKAIEERAVTNTKTARRRAENKRIYNKQSIDKDSSDTPFDEKSSDIDSTKIRQKNKTSTSGLSHFFSLSEDDIVALEIDDS